MRTEREIQEQYSIYCTQVGDLVSKIKRFELEIERIQVLIKSLDQEYALVTRIPEEDTIIENPQETKAP